MIKSLFPNNILIKDHDLSDEWNSNVMSITKAIFTNELAKTKNYEAAGNDSVELFTEDNFKICPELIQLQEIFIDGFYELACSYSNNTLTKKIITEKVKKYFGRIPFMKHGDYKIIHKHDIASAVGIFYLNDVDNIKYGGDLILHDPGFHGAHNFHEKCTYSVNTKKHRLVICPAYIWHEVRLYTGNDERMAIVVNLDL